MCMRLTRYDVTAVCKRGHEIYRACTHVISSQDSCSNGKVSSEAAVLCDAEQTCAVPDWRKVAIASGKGCHGLHY